MLCDSSFGLDIDTMPKALLPLSPKPKPEVLTPVPLFQISIVRLSDDNLAVGAQIITDDQKSEVIRALAEAIILVNANKKGLIVSP